MANASKRTASITSPRTSRFYKAVRMPSLQLQIQPVESPIHTDDYCARLVDFLSPKGLETERSQDGQSSSSPVRSERISTLPAHNFKKLEKSPSVKVINYPVFFSKSRRTTLNKNLSEKQLTLIRKIDSVKFDKTQTTFQPKEKEKEKPSNTISKKSTFYNIKMKTPLSSERSTNYDGFPLIKTLRSPVALETENIMRAKLSPLNIVSIKPLQPFKPTEKQLAMLRRNIYKTKTRDASEEERDRVTLRE